MHLGHQFPPPIGLSPLRRLSVRMLLIDWSWSSVIKRPSSFVSGPPGNVARQSCHADALLLPETFVGVTYMAIVHTRMTYTYYSVSTDPSPSLVSALSLFHSNDSFPCVITPYHQCDSRRAQSLAFKSGSREQPLPQNSTAHRDLEHAAAVAQKPRQRPIFA